MTSLPQYLTVCPLLLVSVLVRLVTVGRGCCCSVGEFVELFGPFTFRQWLFESKHLPALQQAQGAWLNYPAQPPQPGSSNLARRTRARRFQTDCVDLNWALYFQNMCRGMQLFCLKPPPKDNGTTDLSPEGMSLTRHQKPYNKRTVTSQPASEQPALFLVVVCCLCLRHRRFPVPSGCRPELAMCACMSLHARASCVVCSSRQ